MMLLHLTEAKRQLTHKVRFRWGHLYRGKSAEMSAVRAALDIFTVIREASHH